MGAPPWVDTHVHLLPVRLNGAIRAFFADHGVAPGTFAYPVEPAVVCEQLAAEGVTMAWTLPYVRRPGAADALNAAIAGIVDAQRSGPLPLVAGATVHPADHDPVGVVRRAVEDLGARVLKLHCSVGDHRPDDRRLDAVWDYASEIALPVVVHAGHAASGHTEADELAPIGVVGRRHPEARVIIAHCGHRAVSAALDLLDAHPALHADLTPVVRDPVTLPAARARELADRLLFGSDAPNTAVTARAGRAAVEELGLPAPLTAQVLGGNAARLLDEVRV